MSQTKNNSLMGQLSQLEQVLAWFEREDFDIEEGLAQYESGMNLITTISQRLTTVENKIEVLKQRFDQAS